MRPVLALLLLTVSLFHEAGYTADESESENKRKIIVVDEAGEPGDVVNTISLPERPPTPERPVLPAKPDRPERPDIPQRPETPERPERAERPEKPDIPSRPR